MKTTFPFKKETFESGLRAVYVPMKSTKTVTILVLVGAGSRYETAEINGISHFLEHMFFKGTEKRPTKREISEELDSVGASYNAFTDKEMTGYWVKVDGRHAELAADVVSDIFINSTIPAEEIEKERGVIIGEIDMYEDLPMRKVGDLFEELLYPDHPVGWDIAGRKDVIRSIKRDDFVAYRDKFYRASNTAVVIAGNITPKAAHKLVKTYFKNVPKGRTPRPLRLREKQEKPRCAVRQKTTDQTHLILGCRAYNLGDPRRWSLALLSTILGGNMSSRLFIKIRDTLGLGYYVRASTSLSTDHGYFDISAGVENKRLGEAVEAVLEELRRVKKDGVSAEELARAREYIRGSTLINLESSDELATYYGIQEVLRKEILTPEKEFSMIDKVTPSDITRVARNVFQTRTLNCALVGPHEENAIKRLLVI